MKAAIGGVVLAAVLGGCGGGGSSGGGGTCTPRTTATVTVGAGGFTPKAVCVLPTGTVTFTNSDTVAHDIESGMSCTQLNLGSIPAGGTRNVSFPSTETCSFFDAAHSTDAAFQGVVAVSTSTTGGAGY